MRNFLLDFIFPQKYETHTESHYFLFAISSVEQDSNVHGMAPSSLSTKPCILLPFHKSHLLPVSQMKLLLTEGYYSHTRALPSSVPWTIKVFKDSHSYLCKVSFQIFFSTTSRTYSQNVIMTSIGYCGWNQYGVTSESLAEVSPHIFCGFEKFCCRRQSLCLLYLLLLLVA